ncbi:MAG: helix-hairpin-helix domain-containing protein [Rhodoferax sp.]|nr:helix-hairpin-helix domain-containing protein [Rhodoferax sp.]
MKKHLFCSTLMVAAITLMAGQTMAADSKAAPVQTAASKPAAAKVKLIDINSANTKTLLTLPGLTEAQASKIIAARPLGSKAWLVTKDIISAEHYAELKNLVVANQTAQKAPKATP